MPTSQRLKSILNRAKAKEKKYDWERAAELYGQALSAVRKTDFLRKGEIHEKIGHCFYRAAFQTETRDEFKKHMGQSADAYEEAARLFEEMEDSEKHARINSCNGLVSYSKSWLAEDASERRALLDECLKLEKEAAKVYEKTGDKLGYGKACNELLTCLWDRLLFAWDAQELESLFADAMEYGEKAIEASAEGRDEYELAQIYCMLSIHYWFAVDTYESVEKQKEIGQKCLSYAQKALDISEKVEDLFLISMSNWAIGLTFSEVKGDLDSALKYAEKALELGTKIKDNLLIARACTVLASVVWWKTHLEEDPYKRRKGYKKAIQYAEDALTCFQRFSYPYTMAHMLHIESYVYLALNATDLKEKRVLLKKAVEVGRKHLEQTERSGSPHATHYVSHSLSKALHFLSTLETKINEKRRLLEEASKHREETIDTNERLYPFVYWNRGVFSHHSALIKAELAKIETNNQEKKGILRKAVMSMEDCLKFCETYLKALPQTKLFNTIGSYQDHFGSILNQVYLLTGEKRHLERAIRVYEAAVQSWEKADRYSRMAETHWKMAKLHDLLGEHSKAAREFKSASERYKLAAEKIPQLKTFYTDHSAYVKAWSEIERAKHHHAEKQYGQARERYEKAANLHKATERWKYLSPNYLALARFEEAEDLSRKEQAEEARDLFQNAAKLFSGAKGSIEVMLEKIEVREEKEMATELAKASSVREEYCLGRIVLEEAKVLDRQGDHAASSRKYGLAAEKFQETLDTMEHESDRQELRPIIALCRAWQKMTQAEAEASPDLYLEASQLFEEAKEHTVDQKAKILALGHSSFCKALEAGTRFEATGDMTIYSSAKKHLEAASKYYLKAGFKTASEYARGTHRLFDAYIYVHEAETETEPRKKAQYYQMAERLFQTSAGSYMKANHPEKSEEVRRLLENVREERQLAMSLTKVLHAPTTASTTTSFSTPTPTHEQAVGLERFEHADIQANLILRVKEARVGEDVNLEIELINAGKAPALLIKVEKAIPEGFAFKVVPETCRAEDSFLDLKGKRLNPLKTEEVKMVIQPLSKGTFTMKPRIRYLDENGQYKSHEPEPVTITVKELGIKGWIKGER